MNSPPTPDEAAAKLEAAGETESAALILAMAAELATARQERDALAGFTRSIATLAGHEMSHNSRLIVQAHKVLDVLRVTRRCPVSAEGRHWWMRGRGAGSRCFSCKAMRPDVPGEAVPAAAPDPK